MSFLLDQQKFCRSLKLKSWTVNLYNKYYPYFAEDDGVVVNGRLGLQYAHLYAPRKLRETAYAIDQNTLYGESDLRKVNSIEQASTKHSQFWDLPMMEIQSMVHMHIAPQLVE